MEVSQPLDHITHAVIGGGKTMDFGISNSAEFFDILSRTLYTDQILAVVREVLCNAWDAHIAADCTDRAIEITLDSQNFMVRDYGYGIPHDKIGPIYGVYGASTKKDDGAQTGGFGLGCKAPFAYTDHFEVISYNGGAKTIYNMSKSNAVAKGKPGIITILRLPSTEQGLQVKMPIQGKDYQRFKDVIERIVKNGEMKATLNGSLLSVTKYSEAVNGYIMTTDRVMGQNNHRNIFVRYGNVIYPIDNCDELKNQYKDIEALLDRFREHHTPYQLVLQAPPDSIAVTPSREALSMQEHTISTLKKLFKNFLAHTKPLNEQIQIQMKALTDEAIASKRYDAIFRDGWGFYQKSGSFSGNITDLVSMTKYQLTKSYPYGNLKFRLDDVEHRISKAAELKILDPHLAKTFLDELPTVKEIPSKYSRSSGRKSSDWLHRRILGKVMVKLRNAGIDETGLMIRDTMDPGCLYNKDNKATPVRQIFGRNHLINMPFLRKTVVITTALTQLEERLYAYASNNHGIQTDGMLVYYIRTRKKGCAEPVIDVFTKLGYEIIDLTKRHAWEREPEPAAPRRKPEAYAGLPALSCIASSNSSYMTVHAFRREKVHILPTPELVMVISLRNTADYTIDGYSAQATKALIALYGNRIGIAKDKTEMNRAIKNGAKHYRSVVEQEMLAVMVNSPALKEFFAFDHKRVRDGVHYRETNTEMLKVIYRDKDLRKEFGLLKNLTTEEQAMLTLYRQVTIFNETVTDTITQYINTIPLAPENQIVVAACKNDNEMLDVLDISHLAAGLKGLKRAVYLDILIKVLKG